MGANVSPEHTVPEETQNVEDLDIFQRITQQCSLAS